MSRIDLHTHSEVSDGTLSPTALVAAAKSAGLSAIALTDHDTTLGLSEATKAGRDMDLEVIPGCELSVDYPRGHMHLLGLYLPQEPKRLNAVLQELRQDRHSRNRRIVDKLRGLNIDIRYQEVVELAGGGTVGRPHLARVLMAKGVVGSVDQAFAEYLGPAGKAYVPKKKLSVQQGLKVLKEEGATIILAHPYSLGLSPDEFKNELKTLKSQGLDGLEAFYSEHSSDQTDLFIALAQNLDLLVSGGSDFHGSVKPGIALGRGKGDLAVPYALLHRIKEHRRRAGLPVA